MRYATRINGYEIMAGSFISKHLHNKKIAKEYENIRDLELGKSVGPSL